MKKINMKKLLNIIYLALAILGGLLALDLIATLVVHTITQLDAPLLIGSIIAVVLLATIAFGIITSGRLIYYVFYDGIYITSIDNFDRFLDKKSKFKRYDSKFEIDEFNELNSKIDRIETDIKNEVVTNLYNDYNHLGLAFTDSSYTVVTYDSMTKNIRNLIQTANHFRNAFVEINYDLDNRDVTPEARENVIRAIKENFSYPRILIGVTNDNKKYLVFIPYIDSISRLKEEVNTLLESSSIMDQGMDGLAIVMGKVSVVVYPYSDIDDILADLRYAARQGRRIFFYLPNKLFMKANDNQHHIAYSTNNLSKVLSMISALRDSNNSEDDRKIIGEAIIHLIGFLNIDEGGVIYYNQELDAYRSIIVGSISQDKIFAVDKPVSAEFINSFVDVDDEDGTYYFSNRKHANNEVGKYADIYGFESGHFFLIEGVLKPLGLVYFINKKSSMRLDSYSKEALLIFSNLIHNAALKRQYNDEIINMKRRIDNYSKLSNLRLYTINTANYEFTSFSATMKDRNPDIDIGKKCYKCIYGLDAPCKDCPLITNKKKIYSENGIKYETSLSMDEKVGSEASLLIALKSDNLIDHNRFDTDFLVNSYYSFLDRLRGLFLNHSKGYLITMTIDNYKELYEKLGNETYSYVIRQFTQKATEKVASIARLYLFHDNIFACVLPEMGRVDVVDTVETLYRISKNATKDTAYSEDKLNISYEAFKYPQTYDNEKDLMQFIDKYLITEKPHDTDMLHFEENDYMRPASRNAFILQTIDNAVAENTFIMRMQPMVKTSDKHIEGAEILIRLKDDNRNLMFNTFEMIKVAGDNNKIGVISDILIGFIGDIYNKYGYTAFKQFGFNKISLNTEFSYFSDPNFLTNIDKMMKKYFFPKNFLGFEINERDLFENFESFKSLSRAILANGVYLVCDQYSGQYVSIDRLKDLGISEIKVTRNIVKDIDVNQDKLNSVLSIIELAERANIKTTLVGVENVDQYNLIKEDYDDVYMQGYYFYQPLDSNELIEALRKNNR